MKLKPRRVEIPTRSAREAKPIRIIADAAIATAHVGEGRLIPLVILDTLDRPDVNELIRVHEHVSPGDVACQWGELDGSSGKVALFLSFARPAELLVLLEFDIVKQGSLVDQILTAKGLYVQSGTDGDRFLKNPDAPKILVEIPDTGFGDIWDKAFYRHIVKDMRRGGLSRHEAKWAASAFIKEWREFGRLRMKRVP